MKITCIEILASLRSLPQKTPVSLKDEVSHLLLKLLDREVDQKDRNQIDGPGTNVVFCDVQICLLAIQLHKWEENIFE